MEILFILDYVVTYYNIPVHLQKLIALSYTYFQSVDLCFMLDCISDCYY